MTARLIEPSFWMQPLDDRMREIAVIRETGAFSEVPFHNEFTQQEESFYAVTRFDEVVAISKDAKNFSSAQGAISIVDLPPEALEFFGSFYQHGQSPPSTTAGNRGEDIYPPPTLPRCSTRWKRSRVRSSTTSVSGAKSTSSRHYRSPFPLLVICDMMGHSAQRVPHGVECDKHHPERRRP